ncbi:phosphatase PAP2 family protein [Robertmurraya sp. P23]|uniref:phosphatase PAP2 family protein n=1 Tax=Robertmurraya sp. P23 TaxID=3436931 RepID=UPI003D98F24A
MKRTMDWIVKSDEIIFYLLNKQPLFLIQIFRWVTHLGGALCSMGIPLFVWVFGPLELREVVIVVYFSLTLSHLFVFLAKRQFRRLRPHLSTLQATIHGPTLKDPSFPSGHSTAIFSVVTPFILFDPFLAPLLFPIAIMVALSRVILGVHYPTDVLAGSLLGAFTAMGFCHLFF